MEQPASMPGAACAHGNSGLQQSRRCACYREMKVGYLIDFLLVVDI